MGDMIGSADHKSLFINSMIFERLMTKTARSGKVLFTPRTTRQILEDICCDDHCNFLLSTDSVIRMRAGFVMSLTETPSKLLIRRGLVSFLTHRVSIPSCIGAEEVGAVVVDRSIFQFMVCREKFLDILAISHNDYRQILMHIKIGHPFVSHRKGSTGLLHDHTCRSLARVAVAADLAGQFNPYDGSLMLDRGESKRWFLRTNSRGARLDEKLLIEYVGVRIRRRGVDSFMRCDICVTLGAEYRKVATLLKFAAGGKIKKKVNAVSVTSLEHQRRVMDKRKNVLYQLFARYRNQRPKIAERLSGILGKTVNPDSLTVYQCVPDEHVETGMFCELLNDRVKKTQERFKITPADVFISEIIDLDPESISEFLGGALGKDFSLGPDADDGTGGGGVMGARDEDTSMDAGGNDPSPPTPFIDGDTDLDAVSRSLSEAASRLRPDDPLTERKMALLTALERLVALRRFHNEHITAERMTVYSAFETAAMNPLAVLAFSVDGLSKDKCKLPNKIKGKNDETVNRVDCYVSGVQMSVPRADIVKPSPSEVDRDLVRLAEIKRQGVRIRADPSAFSDEVKKALDDEMSAFADKDIAAASGYGLSNHDFIYPYGWAGIPSTDTLFSSILHMLRSDQVAFIPSCIALVLDNAATNKSIGTIRAFALLLELVPRLQEIHLMFPSVGHTHNSLDAHFGALCNRLRDAGDVGTPKDLADCFETVKDTRAHLEFDHYRFAANLEDVIQNGVGEAYSFEYISHQHYFLLYRDSYGDVRFSNQAFLRFAEPLSLRVSHLLSATRDLVPLTDFERELGCPVFVTGRAGRALRANFAKTVFPLRPDPDDYKTKSDALFAQLEIAGMGDVARKRELSAIPSGGSGVSLFDACAELSRKTPLSDSSINGVASAQEIALGMHLRLRGRGHHSASLMSTISNCEKKAVADMVTSLTAGLDGDDIMRDAIIKKLEAYLDTGKDRKLEMFVDGLKKAAPPNASASASQSSAPLPIGAQAQSPPTTPKRLARARRTGAGPSDPMGGHLKRAKKRRTVPQPDDDLTGAVADDIDLSDTAAPSSREPSPVPVRVSTRATRPPKPFSPKMVGNDLEELRAAFMALAVSHVDIIPTVGRREGRSPIEECKAIFMMRRALLGDRPHPPSVVKKSLEQIGFYSPRPSALRVALLDRDEFEKVVHVMERYEDLNTIQFCHDFMRYRELSVWSAERLLHELNRGLIGPLDAELKMTFGIRYGMSDDIDIRIISLRLRHKASYWRAVRDYWQSVIDFSNGVSSRNEIRQRPPANSYHDVDTSWGVYSHHFFIANAWVDGGYDGPPPYDVRVCRILSSQWSMVYQSAFDRCNLEPPPRLPHSLPFDPVDFGTFHRLTSYFL